MIQVSIESKEIAEIQWGKVTKPKVDSLKRWLNWQTLSKTDQEKKKRENINYQYHDFNRPYHCRLYRH